MIKVFVVEDEFIMRSGIKNNIDWEKEGMEFVGEAGDGELAYPLIKKTKPDILITDIRMPFMDGLELSRIVKKELPKTKIMIISGFGEFEYAKQAISIGVNDYLLKPISSVKLLEAVRKIAEVITKERKDEEILEQYQKDMEEATQVKKEKLLSHLAIGTMSSLEVLERGRQLGMEFCASCYQVLLFKVIPVEERNPENLDQVRADIQDFITSEEGMRGFRVGIEGFTIILEGSGMEELSERLKHCIKQLKEFVGQYPQLQYFGGIGSVVERLGDIPKSNREASKAFAGRFFTDVNQVVTLAQVEQSHSQSGSRIDLEEIHNSRIVRSQVEDFLKNGTVGETEEFFEEYFLNAGVNNNKSLIFRQYVMMDLYMIVVEFLEGIGLSTKNLSKECADMNQVIAESNSVPLVKGYLKKLYTEVLTLRDGLVHKKYGMLLDEAKSYIKENFQSTDISLNAVAAAVNISASYLSTIFSQASEETFVEYLTKIRMEKAREMLMCTSLRSSEIGFQVGYKDSHYFSYIFKKMTGCTPKEYRMRGKE